MTVTTYLGASLLPSLKAVLGALDAAKKLRDAGDPAAPFLEAACRSYLADLIAEVSE